MAAGARSLRHGEQVPAPTARQPFERKESDRLILEHSGIGADVDDESGPTGVPRQPQLRLYPGGPLIIRGAVELVGVDGRVLNPRRRVVALCRCGRSALLPYCDGNHKQVASFSPERELRQ